MRPNPKMQTIQINAAQLAVGVEAYVQLPFASDFIFLPFAKVIQNPLGPGMEFVANCAAGAVYGIRINDPAAPILVFTGDVVSTMQVIFEGTVTAIYIQPLNAAAVGDSPTFLIGKDCDLGFAGGVY